MDHVVGPGQVEAGAPGLEGQDEHLRAVGVVLEALHHQVPLFPGYAAVEERGFEAVGLLPCCCRMAPISANWLNSKLAEQQHPVPAGQYLIEDLLQAGQLAGASGDGGVVTQQLAWVVAGLLELGQVSRMEPLRFMPSADSSRVSASRNTA